MNTKEFQVELDVGIDIIPLDYLVDELKRRLEMNDFENIEEIKKELTRRNCEMEIIPTSNKRATLIVRRII